jgi:hypothetical protein
VNNCNITRNTFKWIHSCRSSLFNNKLHFVCVNLPWSIRLLVKTNCSLRLVMQDQGVLTTKWSISCNLLSICWSQLGQLSCQLFNKYFIIKGLKSVYGIRQLNICFSNASLAYRSTTVLSWIPIYNQESMWKWHVYQKATSFLFLFQQHCIFKIKGLEFWGSQLPMGKKGNQSRLSNYSYYRTGLVHFFVYGWLLIYLFLVNI